MPDRDNFYDFDGIFFAVVGASGVGKDTILKAAHWRLVNTGQFYFPTRFITRQADPDGEDHAPISGDEFAEALKAKIFCLWWNAHGLQYGLPKDVFDRLHEGQHVIANLSRSTVQEAAAKFSRVEVIEITARRATISQRLHNRARESEPEIESRKMRSVPDDWADGLYVSKIENDGSVRQASNRFVETVFNRVTDNVLTARTA